MRTRRRAAAIATAAFAVYLVALALVVFWPTHVDRGVEQPLDAVIDWFHSIGLGWVSYGRIEFTANIVLFIPFGVLLTVILGTKRWWLAVLIAVVVSLGIETAQALFLSGRTPTLRDVIANSVGSLIGALLALADPRLRRPDAGTAAAVQA